MKLKATILIFVCFSFTQVSQAGQAAQKLRVGYLTVAATNSPLYIAKEARFFEKNGLDVERLGSQVLSRSRQIYGELILWFWVL
jgi:ABC-type nitrate/sulfonate/bicarbonate transport system substrate-binding protein